MNRTRSSTIARLGAFIASLLLVTGAWAWPPELGEVPQPITSYEYLDGKPIDLAAFRGQPTVLYFGADWCVPCVMKGKPATLAVFNKYKSRGLQLLFVSMDDNKFRPGKVVESQQLGIPFAMARSELCQPGKCLDGLRDAGTFGRIFSYPTAIVLNADGQVTEKLGGGGAIETALDSAVRKVLK